LAVAQKQVLADGHSQRRLQIRGEGLIELRPGTLGAVHVPGEAHDDGLSALLPDQPPDLLQGPVPVPAVNHGGIAHDGAGEIGNGNAGAGVAIVDSQYFHKALPFLFGSMLPGMTGKVNEILEKIRISLKKSKEFH